MSCAKWRCASRARLVAVFFNVGVELGQACIVLAVAPALVLLYRRNAIEAERVLAAAAFCVVFAGTFWFAQRLL